MAAGSPSSNEHNKQSELKAPAPAKPTAGRPVMSMSWLSEQGRMPLAFMGLALAWMAIGTAMILLSPSTLAEAHFAPHVVSLTHAWVLGFFVTVACGAIYQLAPVALVTTLVSDRLGWAHFWLHLIGVPGMVIALRSWNMQLLASFAVIVVLGIIVFAINVWKTVHQANQPGVISNSIALATGWLLITVLVGLTLALNRIYGFISLDALPLLRAHAHLGLVGFFATLIFGIGFQLVPMFTLGRIDDWRLASIGLWGLQVGLVGLVVGFLGEGTIVTFLSSMVIFFAWVVSTFGMVEALKSRKKRKLDPGVITFLCGGVGLGIGIFFGMFVASPWVSKASMPGGFAAMSYAMIAIGFGLLPCIAGMMCKIVPFLTWMRAYGPRVGRGITPSASALTQPKLEKVAFTLLGIAILVLLVGVWHVDVPVLRFGSWILTVAVILFLKDMLGVMRHLWRPITEAPKPSAESLKTLAGEK